MNLDPILLEILACPCERHDPVRTGTAKDPDAEVIQCTTCLTTFPVQDDIPVMLLDEATPGPNGIGNPVTPAE
jgi:uncharacterized protein